MAGKLTKQEKSWILYDVGNSAFVLLATALIPVYFKTLAEPGSSVVVAWGYAETVASLLLALLMPVLGSLADLKGNKKKFFIGTVGTGAIALAALGIPSAALAFLVIYVVASIMLNGSMVFYDAFLVDATTDERYDEVSSQGYAWGYIGSCVPFILCLIVVLAGPSVGIPMDIGMKIAFLITAVWWVAFSVPLIRDVHQTHYKERAPRLIRDTFAGLFRTLKRIWKDRRLRYFMLAFFCYIDGVHTIIKMSTSYGTDLGIDATQLVFGAVGDAVRGVPVGHRLRASVHKIRHEAHAAGSYRRVLLHHAVRGVLPERGRGVLDAGHLRGVVPGRHPSAVAQRVRQAHSEGARQRVLRLLRHLRQVRCRHGHVPGQLLHPAVGQLVVGRAVHRRAVRAGLRAAVEDA